MASRLVRANEVTVNDVLDGHKLLEIGCADRIYLTLSAPSLVVGRQVVNFLDLRRLRLNGLVRRIEHTHTYVLTPEGQRLAIFYTKLYHRLLRPLAAANQPQAPPELRHALAVIDRHVDDYIALNPPGESGDSICWESVRYGTSSEELPP